MATQPGEPYVSHTEPEALIPNRIIWSRPDGASWAHALGRVLILTISPQDDFGDVRAVALRFGWTVEVHPDCPPGQAYFSEQGFRGR